MTADSSWVMSQSWNNLLFAHWPVSQATIRALVPPSLTLDLHDGTAWLSITPFHLSDLRPRGLPGLPWASEFPEINVRTYVTIGGRPGVYFFSLDAGSALAVAGARALYHLPYFQADMSIHERPDGSFDYRSRRTAGGAPPAEFGATYHPTGDVYHSEVGSLEHFLTERYYLYAVDSGGHLHRAVIDHVPWPLQRVDVTIATNTMAGAVGITLDGLPRQVSFTRRLDVKVWLPERL